MTGLIFVEGVPGTGKSTAAHGLAEWLRSTGRAADYWPEGRTDHPVDFEDVAVLSDGAWERIVARFPTWQEELLGVTSRQGEISLVRHPHAEDLPAELVEELRHFDAYDGAITAALHTRVLTENWRRFGSRPSPAAVQLWECVLLQNPACALLATFDEGEAAFQEHVVGLVEAVASQRPALIYLDPGDPADVLRNAAAHRPAAWLDMAIRYHTERKYGLRHGLRGFEGYVEFMRYRRDVELRLLPHLPLPTLVVDLRSGTWLERTERMREFVGHHLEEGRVSRDDSASTDIADQAEPTPVLRGTSSPHHRLQAR